MCRSLAAAGGIAAAMVVAVASIARAEPIQIVYKIDVFKQCEYRTVGETCRDYEASFPLTLTFDAQIVNEHGDDADRTRFYGTPSISDIPLPRRTDFPAVAQSLRQAAERARFAIEENGWLRESSVLIRYDGSRDGSDYHRDFSLTADGKYSSVPDLNPLSFTRFLGTAPSRQFSVADSIELANGGFEALAYYGHVSLFESPVATPEPASMLLLSTGLGLLAVRRQSRTRKRAALSGDVNADNVNSSSQFR